MLLLFLDTLLAPRLVTLTHPFLLNGSQVDYDDKKASFEQNGQAPELADWLAYELVKACEYHRIWSQGKMLLRTPNPGKNAGGRWDTLERVLIVYDGDYFVFQVVQAVRSVNPSTQKLRWATRSSAQFTQSERGAMNAHLTVR